jgi:hypothetical protein
MGEQMNKEQLDKRIDEVCEQFTGQIPDLFQIIGIMVVGRLFGWRVVRLTCSRRVWGLATKWFGDPKDFMPERGRLAHKSQGLALVDKLGDYWDFINGNRPRDDLPVEMRKLLV